MSDDYQPPRRSQDPPDGYQQPWGYQQPSGPDYQQGQQPAQGYYDPRDYFQPTETPKPPKKPRRHDPVLIIAASVVALVVCAVVVYAIGHSREPEGASVNQDVTPAAVASPTDMVSPSTSSTDDGTMIVVMSLDLEGADNHTMVTGGRAKQCTGTSEYADIKNGAEVEIEDSYGNPLVNDKLGNGFVEDGACQWMIMIMDVPTGEDSYTINVAGYQGPTVSESRMKSGVSLTLGD